MKNLNFFYLELPWDIPSADNEDYKLWKTNDYANRTPWRKLNTLALSLARKILIPTPSKRYDISQIKSHHWMNISKNCGIIYSNAFIISLIHIQVLGALTLFLY